MRDTQIKQLAEVVLASWVDDPVKWQGYNYFFPIGVLVFSIEEDYLCDRVTFVDGKEVKSYRVNLKSKVRGEHFSLAVVFGCEDTELWYIRPFMWHKGQTLSDDIVIHPSELVEIDTTQQIIKGAK
jgi:hypothetical protein